MSKIKSTRSIGDTGETRVCSYLRRRGWKIIRRNYTVKGGELDIIASRFGTLAFIEVKTRCEGHTDIYGRAADAVNSEKVKHIKYTAKKYIYEQRPFFKRIRFDVAEVYTDDKQKKYKINYIKGAFT